jgi:hypothetical protein
VIGESVIGLILNKALFGMQMTECIFWLFNTYQGLVLDFIRELQLMVYFQRRGLLTRRDRSSLSFCWAILLLN